MKITKFINSALLIASIAFVPGIVGAETVNNSNNSSYIQPFHLVFLAYQGYLEKQGIPSMANLLYEYRVGKVTAQDIVEAGVKANRLPAEVINDESYLNVVDLQLSSLDNNDLDF
ncbi:MAG: hypothetical protein RMX96_17215 [Nostoc sp. ChiSLP02]|nr:hypothetical protein [Nostoc sp. DedSLP05]MDZ8100018.1 hypothetical protein [Nostoc sp. DedSLP01]MDZ8186575.1 hypothetical protein [Nostoc sp. ChiSLP02]